MAPELRRAAELHIKIPEPFDFTLTVAKPAGWHWSTPREVFEDGTMYAGLYLRGKPVGLKLLSAAAGSVTAVAFAAFEPEKEQIARLKAELELGLGKNLDLKGFYSFARKDPVLKKVTKDRYGMRIGRLDDIFGRVILAILLQMAQTGRSGRMMESVLQLYGRRLRFEGKEVVLWPTPSRLARVDESELRQKANLGYRARLLSRAAAYLAANPVSMLELEAMPDEEALARVRMIPGIGQYAAGIVLGRYAPIDAWSVIVMSELLLGETPAKPRQEIESMYRLVQERWGKWSWMAFAYILNDLDNLAEEYHLTRLS
jgi:DNA-3-methyladenine glycosylase II